MTSVQSQGLTINRTWPAINTPACLTFAGDLTFNAGATLVVEIGGAEACTQHDRISVAGTLTLNGPTLQVRLIDGYAPAGGERFDVLDWGNLAGAFGTVDLSSATLREGLDWDVSALQETGELIVTGMVDVPALPGWGLVILTLALAASGSRATIRHQCRV